MSPEIHWTEPTIYYRDGNPFLDGNKDEILDTAQQEKKNTKEQFESEGWTLGEKNFLVKLLNQEFLKDNLYKIVSFTTIPDTQNNSIATYIHIGNDIGKIPNDLKDQSEIKRAFQVIEKDGKIQLGELTKIGTEWTNQLESDSIFSSPKGNYGGPTAFEATRSVGGVEDTGDFGDVITPENIDHLKVTQPETKPPETNLPFDTGTDE